MRGRSESIRLVKLYGILGATFGREFKLSVSSPKEAIRALCVIVPGFERFLNTSKQRGLTYAVFSGKRNLVNDELSMDQSAVDIRIAPVIIGSKRGGVFQTILGAVLVVASIWMPGLSIAASNLMFAAGATMAVGGVTNTTAQGNPVPLLYGKRRIGGAIVSAGIYVEDQQ